MSEEYLLILGSKPDSQFPDVKVKKIYSANGAAERALDYKVKYPNWINEYSYECLSNYDCGFKWLKDNIKNIVSSKKKKIDTDTYISVFHLTN